VSLLELSQAVELASRRSFILSRALSFIFTCSSQTHNCLATITTCKDPAIFYEEHQTHSRQRSRLRGLIRTKESYENCLCRLPYTLLCPALVVLSRLSFVFAIPRVHRMIPILHHLRPNPQTERLDLLDIVLRPDRQLRLALPHDKRRSPYGRMTRVHTMKKGKQVDPHRHRATNNPEGSVRKPH